MGSAGLGLVSIAIQVRNGQFTGSSGHVKWFYQPGVATACPLGNYNQMQTALGGIPYIVNEIEWNPEGLQAD
jgi:hypothetical protein